MHTHFFIFFFHMMFRSSQETPSVILVAQLPGVSLPESFHTTHAIQIHNAPNPVFKTGQLPLYIWNSKTIFPCSNMKLLMSSPRAVNIIKKKKHWKLWSHMVWLGSAAGGGTTAELLEAPACYRSAPARPRSPGLESLPWMPIFPSWNNACLWPVGFVQYLIKWNGPK